MNSMLITPVAVADRRDRSPMARMRLVRLVVWPSLVVGLVVMGQARQLWEVSPGVAVGVLRQTKNVTELLALAAVPC